jgi:hypothetical protein
VVRPDEVPPSDIYAGLLRGARSEDERLASARDAERLMRVLDAARLSSQKGQVVELFEAVG